MVAVCPMSGTECCLAGQAERTQAGQAAWRVTRSDDEFRRQKGRVLVFLRGRDGSLVLWRGE
jgi:hypothetical protein